MKDLKKTLLTFTLTIFAFALLAQNFGVKAGLNLANVLAKDDNTTYSEDFMMNPGFNAGLLVDFPIADMFAFETGVVLNTKGYKIETEFDFFGVTSEVKGTANMYYVDVPLLGKVNLDAGGVGVFAKLGPYVGLGLSGKSKSESTSGGVTEESEEDITFGGDENEDDFKPLDFGAMVGAGVVFNAFQVELNYALGLANIAHHDTDGYKINNRVISLSVGYWLNR